MSAIIKHGIQCSHCGEIILKEDIETPHDIFTCSECNEMYETEKEAELCCKSSSKEAAGGLLDI